DGVNDAPVWMASLPSLDAGPAAGPMTLDLKPFAADPDAADTLAWSLVSVSNPSLFSSIAVNPATGVLTAVPHSHASGSTSVTVAATDLSGATTSASFTITIPAPPLPTATGGTTLLSSSQPNVFRQEITLTQPAGRASGGFDLVVSGLPADVIFLNPSSSAPGGGTVEFHRILGTGESATVVLEYSRPSGGTFTPPVVTVVPGVFETADRTFGLEDVKRPAGEGISFRFPTTPGRSYRIRRTSNLSAWNTSGEILKAAGTRLFWRDREPANQEGATPQFYRAEEVPE
ncbi:MAG TPA: putative Ig domain-containing protein, partial [Haloferula sp.]